MLPELGGGQIETGNLGATFEAAARYLRALAGRRGLLVVLEDLHWADATSLSLIPFLARALRRDPVALVLTYRPDDETGSARRSPACARSFAAAAWGASTSLGPLSPDEAGAMLAEILGVAPAPEVAAELMRLAAGNPFALQELAVAALESGWIDAASGGGRAPGRAASLDPGRVDPGPRRRPGAPERELIAWAAAIGERFDLRLLSAGADLPPGPGPGPARES